MWARQTAFQQLATTPELLAASSRFMSLEGGKMEWKIFLGPTHSLVGSNGTQV